MGQDDKETPRGFLYRWVNEEKTFKAIPPSVMIDDHEGEVPCEVYSRIVGYIRPVRNWNKGKKQEYEERREYKIEVIE